MSNKDVIICRCEDVTLQDLHDLMEKGYTSFEELKRLLRIGMGPCQGSTCGQLVLKEISKFVKISPDKVITPKIRPLISGVKLNAICEANSES